MSISHARHEIEIWQIQALGEHPRFATLLSAEERQRAARFHHAAHSIQWRYYHCAMREILSGYTACPSAELRFAYIARNKPVLVDFPGIFFNLSHSANRALFAVTAIGPVGIDIEFNRQLTDRQSLVERNFSHTEQHTLAQLPQAEMLSAFYRVWTRKEAVIKSHGLGLGITLDKFDVPCGALPAWQQTHIRDSNITQPYFQLRDVTTANGFTGAVALHASQPTSVKLHSVDYVAPAR